MLIYLEKALVAASSQGIGKAIAFHLAKREQM